MYNINYMNNDSDNNDLISLTAAVLHLQRASRLIDVYDNKISIILLELANSLLNKYNIDNSNLDELCNFEKIIMTDE